MACGCKNKKPKLNKSLPISKSRYNANKDNIK